MEESDEQLIARMARRDEAALAELHRRYAPYLMALGVRMLRDRELAQQCVQDAFLNAWNASARFDARLASAKTWLVTIGHRRMLNALRSRGPAEFALEEWDAPTPARDLDERVVVRRAVDTLDGEERQLIELAFYQGYTHQELALMTGKPLGTVKTRLRSALARLKQHFLDRQARVSPSGEQP